MKRLIIAIQFLTRLPTPRVAATDADFAASMRWFPAVGAIVGAIVAGAAWAGAWLDPWTGALAGVAAWVLVTGALHLDGLGDLADASGAAHKVNDDKDRERLLAVLADPHVGSFAVVAIGLQLLAKLVLLHAIVGADLLWPLIAVPFGARIGPLVWTQMLPPLHRGLAARFADAVRPFDIAIWAVALCGVAIYAPALLAVGPLVLLWAGQIRRTLGGISGDGHGAGIELVETGLLLALLIAARPAA